MSVATVDTGSSSRSSYASIRIPRDARKWYVPIALPATNKSRRYYDCPRRGNASVQARVTNDITYQAMLRVTWYQFKWARGVGLART